MYIALDIGGTTIRIAATEDLNTPSLSLVEKIPTTNNYTQDFSHIVETIKNMAAGKLIQGIGCGFPGTFSEDKKTILVAPNVSDWNNKNFAGELEKEFGCLVKIENDDTIAALGEATYGHGKSKDFVYITWGTGFGGVQVQLDERKIMIKQFEAGHQIIVWENGRACGCGQTGCVEAYIGGGNVEKYYKKKVNELGGNEWNEILEYLANALINIVAFYPTNLIIIGGGVAIHNKNDLEILKQKIKERLKIYPVPEIMISQLEDDAGLYGAFALLES